jgi:hypothetical protein
VNYDFQYGWSELPENRLELMTSAQKLQYEFMTALTTVPTTLDGPMQK